MKRRIVSFFLVFSIIFNIGGIFIKTKAYTAHTQEEAVAWINSQNNKVLDYDGAYGAQCVDLIYYYYKYLGASVMGGSAKDYAWNALPNGWQRIQYYNGLVPQPGDIFINVSDGGGYGHIGLVISVNSTNMKTLEQNVNYNQWCQFISRSCNYIDYIIRPDFNQLPQKEPWLEDPTISDVTETNAMINSRIHNPSHLYVSTVGCSIWDENNNLIKTHYEAMNPQYNTHENIRVWFDINSEIGITLKKGSKYHYQVFAILSDERTYYSNTKSFFTPPLADKPEQPTVLINEDDVTVSWNKCNNAKGYDIYLIQEPYNWADVKRSKYVDSSVTSYTFNDVEAGDYRAFVISRPNEDHVQSMWTAFTVEDWKNPFTDVKTSDWFYNGVKYVYKNNIFKGITQNTYEPQQNMSRAMMVTALWRMSGSPVEGQNMFSDVPDNQWYTKAVNWAAENEIVTGVGYGKFEPSGYITREQMVTMLKRYAEFINKDTSGQSDIDNFNDYLKVSDWAVSSMKWAVNQNLIKGKDNNMLEPKGLTTRAEISVLIQRFFQST